MGKPILKGFLAFIALLTVYFSLLTLISGWTFALEEFSKFWYYITGLALGFAIQFGLYTHLKNLIKERAQTGHVLTATGTTSTAAMISCCAHYLTNILPLLGVAGIITFISQYQVKFFWLGLLFNFLGILYLGNKVLKFSKQS
ncbi:hypothetical protein HYS95_00885 [Candidatus Daviesbacteria bacterium]|nr:hypothetical protein [Candidatus Daviesbacteria bacterium]